MKKLPIKTNIFRNHIIESDFCAFINTAKRNICYTSADSYGHKTKFYRQKTHDGGQKKENNTFSDK